MSVKDTTKVAESYKRLYAELGESKVNQDNKDNREKLKTFLEKHIPRSDQNQIEPELKRTIPFKTPKRLKQKKKSEERRRKGKCLTAREKRDLGLAKLPKKGLKYESFLPLNKLWQEYIRRLVDFSKWKPGDEGVQIKLCRADFHGALVKVTRSKSSTLVGVEGLVVMETRNTFQIIDKEDKLKIVPKLNTSFTFQLDSFIFSLSGSSMMMKPAERAVKKWKNKLPMDI